jgi:hypothetical protein
LTQGKNRLVCKPCRKKHVSRWRKNHPEQDKEIQRKNTLKRRYAISPEEYQRKLEEQRYLCGVCGLPLPLTEEGKLPPVDHDHITGTIRSIVHGKCNRGLGMFDDNPTALRKAAEYLEKYQ